MHAQVLFAEVWSVRHLRGRRTAAQTCHCRSVWWCGIASASLPPHPAPRPGCASRLGSAAATRASAPAHTTATQASDQWLFGWHIHASSPSLCMRCWAVRTPPLVPEAAGALQRLQCQSSQQLAHLDSTCCAVNVESGATSTGACALVMQYHVGGPTTGSYCH